MIKALKKWARLYRRGAAPGAARQPRARTSALYGGMGERELELRMELMLKDFVGESDYSVSKPSRQLAALSLSEQERFLTAIKRLAQHNSKLAYGLCCDGVDALTQMSEVQWEEWLVTLEDKLRDQGESAALTYLKALDSHMQTITLPKTAVLLSDIAPLLERLITALGGRQLSVLDDEEHFTDTERVYLPPHCADYADCERNFAFYKVCAVFLWAQVRFGTWQIDIPRLLYDLPDPERALALFQVLENLRLDACIERELPGVARIITTLGRQSEHLPANAAWRQAAQQLAQETATSQDSLSLTASLYRAPLPPATVYQGVFKPTRVMRTMQKRIAAERVALEERLLQLTAKLSPQKRKKQFKLDVERGTPNLYEFKLSQDGEEIEITPEIQRLLESVMQDLGTVPEEYLHSGELSDTPSTDETEVKTDAATAMWLPEWDHSIQHYRPDWCRVVLRAPSAGDSDFTAQTLLRHQGLVKQLRRTFEALRESDCRQKYEPYGEEINLDAAIESLVSARRGEEPSCGIYIRRNKTVRDIAVVFLIDMSGSTSGWVNQIEKEALVLLCESLETLGDRYAIFGFSGETRECCNLFEIKSFEEHYDDTIKRNIGGIAPQNYTRMGAAIRFAHKTLVAVDAKTRLMITISDGRPDDRDGYRGQYGIEDTRRALLETSFQGVHPYCITIDTEAADYLPYMYGRANFSIVSHIEKLPFQVSDIYRRITS